MAMKMMMIVLALQVAPPTFTSKEVLYLLSGMQFRRPVSSGGLASSCFVVLNFAQVAVCSAVGEGPCVAAAPAEPPGLFGCKASASSGGGGGEEPPDSWKGILAELICMCSGAVPLCVYIHLY